MEKLKNYDAIILGGGPAGINCALELHESKVNYILIDRQAKLGGQLNEVQNSIRNFAARYWPSGIALRDDLETLCQKIGIVSQLAESINKIDLNNKTLTGAKNTYKGKTIFLATGTRPRMLPIKGVDSVKESIISNVEENEARLSGKSIAIIGGGDNALMDAAWLAQHCPRVLLIHRHDRFKARPDVIENVINNPRITIIKNSEIESASGTKGILENIVIKNSLTGKMTTHSVDYLVIKVGFAPNSELFAEQIKTDTNGAVLIDQLCQTNIEGIFAGGDLVSPDCWGIARSAGHGLIAARAICKYLTN